MGARCKCRMCQLGRKIKAVLHRQTSRRDRALIRELYEMWMNDHDDVAYWKAKFEGTWPS